MFAQFRLETHLLATQKHDLFIDKVNIMMPNSYFSTFAEVDVVEKNKKIVVTMIIDIHVIQNTSDAKSLEII